MAFFREGLDLNEIKRLGANIEGPLGFEIVKITEESQEIEGRFIVNELCLQPFGLLHGGVSCLLAESLGSLAGNLAADEGYVAVGQSLTANHLRSGGLGDEVQVKARNIHRGRSSQVWNITFHCRSKILSQVSLTLAVIKKP